MASFLQCGIVKLETRLSVSKALENEKLKIPIERVLFQIGIGTNCLVEEEGVLIEFTNPVNYVSESLSNIKNFY